MNHSSRHIVIAGAGIVGAAIAFQLARRGARITILDAARPGQGASAVSFAWINARDKNPRHYHDLNRRSVDMWDRFARLLGGQIGLTWGGELRWAATPEGARNLVERVKTLQSWAYPIKVLDAAAVARLEPGIVPGPIAAASYTAVDGHVDTARVIQACLDDAIQRGAELLTGAPLTELELASGDGGLQTVTAVQAGGRRIPCDVLVLAGGPDAPELAGLAGIDLPVRNTFGATILTQPVAPIFRRLAVLHSASDSERTIVVRQLPDGAVMIHGGDAGTATGSLGQTDAEIEQVMAIARDLVPALAGAQITEVRRGRRPVPKDGQSILGFTGAVPNLYLASTHSGVTLAPLIGEFAAIEIVDGVSVDLLEPFRLERFG